MRRILLVLLIGGTAACAYTGDRREAEMTAPQVRKVGAPVSCVPIARIQESRVINDRIIDFHMGGRKVLRNELPHSCPGLEFEKAFTYATSLSQLCSTDIITVIHQGGGLWRGASCGLGQFQPVEGAAK